MDWGRTGTVESWTSMEANPPDSTTENFEPRVTQGGTVHFAAFQSTNRICAFLKIRGSLALPGPLSASSKDGILAGPVAVGSGTGTSTARLLRSLSDGSQERMQRTAERSDAVGSGMM